MSSSVTWMSACPLLRVSSPPSAPSRHVLPPGPVVSCSSGERRSTRGALKRAFQSSGPPTLLTAGTGSMEEFSMDRGWGVIWGWFKCIALSVKSFLLLLYQLHLGASSIRCWRLGTAALEAESLLCHQVIPLPLCALPEPLSNEWMLGRRALTQLY